MSKEKSNNTNEKVCITVRLNDEENEKLRQAAAACGLSVSEFMKRLCMGNPPQGKPPKELWELMNELYEVHSAFKKCVPYYPAAAEICTEIEQLIVDLQEKFTASEEV